ncbi:MAG TPA: nickel-binding protein [Azospirillum sp.]|nr:nickel-binding protein [Azospirillum sp.]
MSSLRLFMDTHDAASGTFPAGIGRAQFRAFFQQYEAACRAEGVVLVKVYVGYDGGRAFCLSMAADADAVRRAHERVGLPFDGITEVETASPADTFLRLGDGEA